MLEIIISQNLFRCKRISFDLFNLSYNYEILRLNSITQSKYTKPFLQLQETSLFRIKYYVWVIIAVHLLYYAKFVTNLALLMPLFLIYNLASYFIIHPQTQAAHRGYIINFNLGILGLYLVCLL